MLSKITSWRHSKVLAFVLAVAVFLTAFYGLTPVISRAEATGDSTQQEATKTIWDGTTLIFSQAFAGQINEENIGTESNPYEITTGTQLYAATSYTSAAYFKLMNDIQLQSDANMAVIEALINAEDPSTVDGVNNLNNWSKDNNVFIGTIDGNFHKITGLYYGTTFAYAGFVNMTNGATIKNITLDKAYLTAQNRMGGIVGQINGATTIDGCSVINSKLVNKRDNQTDGQECVGGIVGTLAPYTGDNSAINNCSVLNTQILQPNVTSSRIGAVFADTWTKSLMEISNTFSDATIPITKTDYVVSYTNVYSTASGNKTGVTQLTSSDLIKGATAYDNVKLTPAHGWVVLEENGYLVYVGAQNVADYDYEIPVWNGNKALTTANLAGTGTNDDPYLVSTGAELYLAVNTVAENYYKLINDIQLQNQAGMEELQKIIDNNPDNPGDATNLINWAPTAVKTFCGHLLGNGKTIYGVYGKSTFTSGNGFIPRAGGSATIQDLTFDTMYFEATHDLGGIVGLVYHTGATGITAGTVTISGCSIENARLYNNNTAKLSETPSNARQYVGVGGIVAGRWSAKAVVTNCAVQDDVVIHNNYTEHANAIAGPDGTVTVSNSIADVPNALSSTGSSATYSNVYSAYTGTVPSGVTKVSFIKGTYLPTMNPTTGWHLQEDGHLKYTGVTGAHPVNTKQVWNGLKFTDISSLVGDGTSGVPYKIYYPYELYAAVNSTDDSVYFELMNDIQLQSDDNLKELEKLLDSDSSNDPEDLTKLNVWANKASTNTFKGNINGNFHTIAGAYISSTSTTGGRVGFFYNISGAATIRNITFNKMYVNGKTVTGGVVGGIVTAGTNAVIDGCTVINSAIINSRTDNSDGQHAVAGFVGYAPNGSFTFTLSNCAVLNTTITQTQGLNDNLSGLWGDTWTTTNKATIENCIVENYPVTQVGNSFVASYSNVYSTVEGSSTAADSSKVTVAEAKFLKGFELPGINASTGWEIKTGEWPKYTGVIGTRPENTKTYWNGLKLTNLDGLDGEGTIDSPKKIYNGYELYAAVNCTTNTYFKLMNDIQLQSDANMLELAKLIDNDDSTNPAEGTTFNDWGKHKIVFKGHIDGNFKTVSGLYINNNVVEGEYGLGFISRAAGPASIDNLTLDQMYVTGKVQIGGFVGLMYGSSGELKISGCVLKNSKLHNTSTVEDVPNAPSDAQYYGVGGIIGGGWNGTQSIKNTALYDTTLISDRGDFAFGFVDTNNGCALTATNCIIEGYLPKDGLGGTYTNVYTTVAAVKDGIVVLSEEQLKSADALPGIRPLTGWEFTEGEYPVYTGVQGTETTNGATYWNGVRTDTLDVFEGSGSGTEADPYIIRHGFELYAAVQNTDSTKHFKLVNDIYLNDVNLAPSNWNNYWAVWQKGKTFSGTLDGNGYTVYGVHEPSTQKVCDTNSSTIGVGLIPAVGTATVKNLHLRNVNMPNCWNATNATTPTQGAAGLVGTADTVTIEGCSVGGTIKTSYNSSVGGFVGLVTGSATIKDSVFVGGSVIKDKAAFYAGSIIGDAGTATVTLTDVVANGYVFLGNGTATETNTFLVNVSEVGYSPAGVKYVLRSGQKSLSDAFYYDFLSENFPQLKNRKATQNVDIDGNAGTELDANDALALKNILLYGGANQVNATDKTNYYNEVEGLDITDLVALYN